MLVNCLILLCFGANFNSEPISNHEGNLLDYLFTHKGYNKLIRPVSTINETLVVRLGLGLIQLINVDEKNQIAVSNVWIRLSWKDYQLQWVPSDFGNLKVVRAISDNIWKPDIVLFNNADGNYEVSWKPNVLIHDNGEILWIPPTIFKSSCDIDVTYFPFDNQMCYLRFGSWTFDANQVALGWYDDIDYVDLSNYWPSGTWELLTSPGKMKNSTQPGQPPRTEIVYLLYIRRKTLYYTVNLICPCVVIAFLTFFVFYLPADAGEKITLSISVLLALVVFLLLVSKLLPPTSVSVPLISKYLLFTFILNIIVIFITVAIININYRTPRTHIMPHWIRFLFMELLPPILFIKRPFHILEEIRKRKLENSHEKSLFGNQVAGESFINHDDLNKEPIEEDKNLTNLSNDISENIEELLASVNFIASYLQSEDQTDRALHDWKYVASVIDRLMLIIFVIITTLGTFGILLNFEKIELDKSKVMEKFLKH